MPWVQSPTKTCSRNSGGFTCGTGASRTMDRLTVATFDLSRHKHLGKTHSIYMYTSTQNPEIVLIKLV